MADDSEFGKYRLVAELGHGGMADVYLAVVRGPVGLGFSKLFVIKRLRANLVEDPEFVAMLIDEARIAARLNHPNVVQTIEVGNVGNNYFIAMEYLDGQPLQRVEQRTLSGSGNGALTTFMRYGIIVDVLAGLHHAHELVDYDGTPLEVVHRDVSPHNVFLTYDGQVKLVDFGIAKAVGRASETRTGVVKGKVIYMAPEQALGDFVDRRADVFSVGVMLWEAAAGRRMWKGELDIRVMQRLISHDIPSSPRAVNPDVPEPIDAMCRRALAASPDDRYTTAAELQQELEHFLEESGRRVSMREVGKLIAETYKEKRVQMKAIIEQKLAEFTGDSEGGSPPVKLLNGPASTSNPALSRTPAALAQTVETISTGSKRRRRKRDAGLGMLAVTMLGLAVLASSMSTRTRRAANAADAAQQPPVPAASEIAAQPEQLALTLRASPPDARFSVDDGPVLDNPTIIHVPKDGLEHQVRARAAGFAEHVRAVPFTDDVVVDVSLERLPDAKKKAAPAVVRPATPTPKQPTGKPKRQLDPESPWPP